MATRMQESAPIPRLNAFAFRGAHDAISPAELMFRSPVEEALVERAPAQKRVPASDPALTRTLVSANEWASLSEAARVNIDARHSARSLTLFRSMDIVLATLFLIVLSPIMIMAALMVFVSSPGPIFYRQPRFGKEGKVFGCLKFRTMKINADVMLAELLESPAIASVWARDRKLPNDPRITYFGHFLRRYSADELPQLLNVLRGDMSIVGPRPLATDEAHFYAGAFAAYCTMKPGITGPWQISGRNAISFAGRAKLDCEYARTKSIGQDLSIILRTIPVVLKGTGC
jgi:lipopolysaccharide/colanic/teichoic acid biosynthesis glycosyltransferase